METLIVISLMCLIFYFIGYVDGEEFKVNPLIGFLKFYVPLLIFVFVMAFVRVGLWG